MRTRLNLESVINPWVIVVFCFTYASPAAAQTAKNPVGGVADTGNGQIGQRQTSAQAGLNIEPLGRISIRLQNRIQNRIHNRIDANYDPQANARSPFEIAGDQLKTTVKPRGR